MAAVIRHAFVSPVIDESDPNKVGPDEWNADHVITGLTGAAVANTPAGNISATDLQAAINELDTEKQPIDSDLTAIAAIAPSNDDIIQRKAGAWTNRTLAQIISDLSTGLQPLDSDLTSWAAITRASGFDTFVASPTAANFATLVTGESYGLTDAELAALAGLTSAADKLPYFTGSGTAALADLSSAMRTFMTTPTSANWAAVVSDDVFSLSDAELGAIAGLTSAADKIPYFTGSGTAALADFSSALRTFLTTPTSANLAALVSDDSFTLTDAELAAIAGLTSAADKFPYFTGSGTAALADLSSAFRTFMTTPSSANFAAVLSDEEGSGGGFVRATSPTIATPSINTITLTGGQIGFPATAAPSANANTLDDYEEGTWTTTMTATGCTFNPSLTTSQYTKIGRAVNITFGYALNTSGNTLAANAVSIGGFPFTISATAAVACGALRWFATTSNYVSVILVLNPNTTTAVFGTATAAGTSNASGPLATAIFHATNGSSFIGSVTHDT